MQDFVLTAAQLATAVVAINHLVGVNGRSAGVWLRMKLC